VLWKEGKGKETIQQQGKERKGKEERKLKTAGSNAVEHVLLRIQQASFEK
jgi:hypothetical protein